MTSTRSRVWSEVAKRVVMGAVVCVVGVTFPLPALPEGIAHGAQPIGEPFFGLHIRFLDVPPPKSTRTSQWPTIPFRSWRLWNSYVDWLDLEPERGGWQFQRLDRYVQMAKQNGVEVLMTLGRTPRWASARPDESCGRYLGCAAEPRNLEDWRNYVRTVASRYKGIIMYYELWNEPAFSEFEPVIRADGRAKQYFSGTAAAMVDLAKVTYETLKEIDPAIRVVTPSVTSEGDGVGRLRTYFRAGGWRYSDIVGFHAYEATPEQIPQVAKKVRDLMTEFGLEHAELWNTEMAYVFERPDKGVYATTRRTRWNDTLDQATGASYVARALLLNLSSGISRVFWFNWDQDLKDDSVGLADDGGFTLLPPGRAYATIQRWTIGTVMGGCNGDRRGTWVCELTGQQGKRYIAWSTEGPRSWRPPASICRSGVVETLDGTVVQLTGEAACIVNIDASPTLAMAMQTH